MQTEREGEERAGRPAGCGAPRLPGADTPPHAYSCAPRFRPGGGCTADIPAHRPPSAASSSRCELQDTQDANTALAAIPACTIQAKRKCPHPTQSSHRVWGVAPVRGSAPPPDPNCRDIIRNLTERDRARGRNSPCPSLNCKWATGTLSFRGWNGGAGP